jgi:hypothetical protein
VGLESGLGELGERQGARVGRGLGGVGDMRGADGAGMGIMAGASFPDQQGLAGPSTHHGVPCHDDIH